MTVQEEVLKNAAKVEKNYYTCIRQLIDENINNF